MNIKNRKDLFLIFTVILVLCAMLPRSLPAIRNSTLSAAKQWGSSYGLWVLPEELGSARKDPAAENGESGGVPGAEASFSEDTAAPGISSPASETGLPASEEAGTASLSAVSDETTAFSEPGATEYAENTEYTEYTEPAYAGPVFVHSDKSYFDNALFIGDSRTADLAEFGGLDNADFYARVGMSVFNLDDKEINVKGYGKVRLDDLLAAGSYGKVYIMLGYNEVGYNFNTLIKKYKELIDRVRRSEPTAIIYLEANLLVSEEYSRRDNDADNPSLVELNRRISELADNETVFYIDVNPLFCENGALKPELSGDGTHPYAKYYKNWVDWLCDNTVDMSSIRHSDSTSG